MTCLVSNSTGFQCIFYSSSTGVRENIEFKQTINSLDEADIIRRKALIQKIAEDLQKNEESLEKYSLLQDSQKIINGSFSTPALVMICLGFSALRTGYEGWNIESAASWYRSIIECINRGDGIFINKNYLSEELFRVISKLDDVCKLSLQEQIDVTVKSIQNLQMGDSYVVKGGWRGELENHAMLYRFQRTGENAFSIYIYNAQSDSDKMQGGLQGERPQTFPYICFENVASEELFFCHPGEQANPVFFETLYRYRSEDWKGKIEGIRKILNGFAHLSDHWVPSARLPELFIRMQHCGSCVSKAFNCMLLDLCADTNLYKRYSLDFHLLTLIKAFHTLDAFFNKLNNSFSILDKSSDQYVFVLRDSFMLREATMNFLRSLEANFKRNVGIQEEVYQKACATACDILRQVDSIHDKLAVKTVPTKWSYSGCKDISSFYYCVKRQTWLYSCNRDFQIDTKAISLDLNVDKVIHLIQPDKQERKLLIPKGEIFSSGYLCWANILLTPPAADRQKDDLFFFEYTLTAEHHIIPPHLEARLYLAHLYLAQKSYQKAHLLLKGISISESLSFDSRSAIEKLLNSAENLKDYSPNACAVRLYTLWLARELDPSHNYEMALKEYQIYLEGLHRLEKSLILDMEVEKSLLHHVNTDASIYKNRFNLLENQKPFPIYHWKVNAFQGLESNLKPSVIRVSILSKIARNIVSEDDYSSLFQELSRCEHFANDHAALQKETSIESLQTQAIVYRLLVHNSLSLVSDDLLGILFLVANYPKQVPCLPCDLSSNEALKIWAIELAKVYQQVQSENQVSPAARRKFGLKIDIEGELVNSKSSRRPFVSKVQNYSSSLKIGTLKQDAILCQWQEHYSETLADDAGKIKFIVRSNVSICDLKFEIEKELKRASKAEKELQKIIASLSGKQPLDFSAFVHNRATELGFACQKKNMKSFIRASTQPDAIAAIRSLNPYLIQEEAEDLQASCIELMIEKTHLRHLENILNHLNVHLDSDKKDANALEAVFQMLYQDRCYNPYTSIFPLLFEYLSDMRIHFKQACIIDSVLKAILQKNIAYSRGKAFQQISEDSRSGTILPILTEIIAEAGKLVCVLSHPSHLAMARTNMALFYFQRFGKNVYFLDYTLQDLSNDKQLDRILERLKKAHRTRSPIIMKNSLPQIIELRLIRVMLDLSNQQSHIDYHAPMETISKLYEIFCYLKEHSVSFHDQCDVNLSILTDVSIPYGELESVNPKHVEFIEKVFCILIDPQIRDLVALSSNHQHQLTSEEWSEQVVPFIADKLACDPCLHLNADIALQIAFKHFISDRMTVADQQLADNPAIDLNSLANDQQLHVRFLRHLRNLSSSSKIADKELVQLIDLARNLIKGVLPITLGRSYNRDYGRDHSFDDGRVKHHLAVGETSYTQFANIYTALAYHFQAALNKGVDGKEILFLAKQMTLLADESRQKESCLFCETDEAKQFYQMTQVPLDSINEPCQLEQAVEFVNDPDHLGRRLAIEAKVAPFHMQYYPKKLQSDAINQINLFQHSIACSATLYNHKSYHWRFEKPKLEAGLEKSILDCLQVQAQEEVQVIYELSGTSWKQFEAMMRRHPHKSRIRALVDGGGFLCDYPNDKVALNLQQFFAKEVDDGGPTIDGIVYMHKFSATDAVDGTAKQSFALLKKGESKPLLLNSTSAEEISKEISKHVALEHLFVYFDEFRATGTNVELADEAVFLNTVDHRMTMDMALLQVARANKLSKGQRISYIVTSKGRRQMHHAGKSFDDLQMTWDINRATAVKIQVDLSRFRQLRDVVRFAILDECSAYVEDHKTLISKVKAYRSFLIESFQDDLPAMVGVIQGKEKVIDMLKNYARALMRRCSMMRFSRIDILAKAIGILLEKFKKEIPEGEIMDMDFLRYSGMHATIAMELDKSWCIEENIS
jgi:hypothetical protein